ncbi:MAG TPA: hypothetical protein DHW02_11655 [Ktedonobacter sp.]|nr:hypothetical protein [Ktedonobacter sp.]
MQTQLSYLVCATPRSGSTFFCESMSATMIAGKPKEYFEQLQETGLPRQPHEYFETFVAQRKGQDIALVLGPKSRYIDEEWLTRFHGAGYAAYIDKVLAEGTTANGVFGAKIMWNYFDDFIHHLRHVPIYCHASDVYELLNEVFPRLHYIWVKRQDTAKQAISLWKAIQTQRWRHDTTLYSPGHAPTPGEPLFHRAAIAHLEQQLIAEEQAWQTFFQEKGIEPLVIVYEQFISSYEKTIRDALQYLGLSLPENSVPAKPPMKRQTDTLSEEWLRRYQL